MRWDSRGAGLIIGLLTPLLGFVAYGTIYITAIRPMYDFSWFVNELFLGTAEFRPRVVSLSLIADALPFFLFDRKDMHQAMRGVIAAMMVYGVYIVVAWMMLE